MELSPRQLKTATRLFRINGGAVWWRVGEGKTRITYKYFAMIAKSLPAGVVPRFVVVCRREAFGDWKKEMKKIGLKWRTKAIEHEDDVFDVKADKPLIYLLSHGKLSRMVEELIECSGAIFGVAYDEGFLYKNPSTDHCKSANKLSTKVGHAIILSGSMMTARDLTDVYGQLYAVNKHSCLARTLTEFRSRYMFKFQIRPGANSHAAKFTAARGAGKRVASRIANCSSIYLPRNSERRIVTDIHSIKPTAAQSRCFDELRQFFELELRGRMLELKNAPSVITKCQQISDGWVKMEDSTLSVAASKMEYLLAQIAELIASGERVIVWCAFRHTVNIILQQLQKKLPSVNAYGFHGGMSFDSKGWAKNGQVAVGTTASGSSVNHFEQVATAIYYSHSFGWLAMQQSRGRTDRKASKHRVCQYHYLQTKGSLDSFVYRLVMKSERMERELITNTVNAWLKLRT